MFELICLVQLKIHFNMLHMLIKINNLQIRHLPIYNYMLKWSDINNTKNT